MGGIELKEINENLEQRVRSRTLELSEAFEEIQQRNEEMNQQQQLISGMLNKENLLLILRTSSVFMDTDGGARIKVVCRYQQFRAANKIIERLRYGTNAEEKS